MKVIWKYELNTCGIDMISCEIEAPRDFEPLAVQLQYGVPTGRGALTS